MPLLLLLLALLHGPQTPTVPASPSASPVIAAPPLFTDAERAALVAFWNAPGRMQIHLDTPRVVLTPAASQWFYAYNRARRTSPAPPDTALWENWVTAKLAYDHWQAAQTAGLSNASPMPPSPGLIPASLLAAVGDPPSFATATAARRYTIDLGDGSTPLNYGDNVISSPRYRYYRFAQGVEYGGTSLGNLPASEIDALFAASGLSPFERHVLQAVSPLEGGFDAVNTYDTGYVSVGFIQFITAVGGNGSLCAVLTQEKLAHPMDFARDFHQRGIDVSVLGILTVVDPATGAELSGPDAVQCVINDPRLVAAFGDAGRRSASFRAAQIVTAKQIYYPAQDVLTVTLADGTVLTGHVSDIIHSEAGMATLFDRKVNTGTIEPDLAAAVGAAMTAHHVTTFAALAPYEREIVTALQYRTDFLTNQALTQPPLTHK